MGSKYSRLQEHLSACKQERVTRSFKEIEKILGKPLPSSARQYPEWWANNPTGHSHCVWMAAGWRTKNLNIAQGRVDFVRDGARSGEGASKDALDSLCQLLAGTVTILDPAALTAPSGERWEAENDTP